MTERQAFEALLERYDAAIAAAFLDAIDDMKAGADLSRLIQALSDGDIAGAIAAMNLDEASLNRLVDSITRAYTEAGTLSAAYMPMVRDPLGARVVFRFNVRNPQAEAWLRNESSRLVTSIMADQRASIQAALEAGMQRGDNPTTTALDIVGRIDKTTGKRSGGIVGLTNQQRQFVSNARNELTSGEPADIEKYLSRKLRDKRFDGTIKKAVAEGKTPPSETVAKAIRAYENRLLKYRGNAIGRTESLTALRAAEFEQYRQAVERGDIDLNLLDKEWDSAGDTHVRHSHMILDGDRVGFFEPFKSPSGALMMFPGDASLGAGAEEIIHCRCRAKYKIRFLAPFLARAA